MAWLRGKFSVFLAVFEVLFIVLFVVFAEYDEDANAAKYGTAKGQNTRLENLYPMFQDVQVMMYIGFGFLMTFLKRYGYGAISFNLLLTAFVVQWHLLMSGFLHLHHGKIAINIISLTTALFASATVLISFGAVLGKTSPLHLSVMAFLEIVVFSVNEYIGVTYFKVVDMGGSMFVHVFGAYFGLAVARVVFVEDVEKSKKEESVYHSDLFSMIGCLFLWVYWPSFNAALAAEDDRHRAVINTYLALGACTVATFIMSSLLGGRRSKFDMVHVQNSTLAGGVAVGTCADLMIHPWGAVVIGCVAAIVSVTGFKFLTPFMNSKLKIHDTCGVHNLHGMPGVLAGVAGAVASAIASVEIYGLSLYEIFPARVPQQNTTAFADLALQMSGVEPGEGRDGITQGGYQMLNMAVTMAMAIVGGLLTGLLLKIPIFNQPKGDDIFEDAQFWEVAEDGLVQTTDNNDNANVHLNGDDQTTKI